MDDPVLILDLSDDPDVAAAEHALTQAVRKALAKRAATRVDRLEKELDDFVRHYLAGKAQEVADQAVRLFEQHTSKAVTEKGTRALAYRTEFQGFPISVETDAGEYREWKDSKGNTGRTLMRHPYGYIRLSGGADGEHVDCYLGPNEEATHVYVVRQLNSAGAYDEDKMFLGFDSEQAAREAFLAHREDGDRAYGGIASFTVEEFRQRLEGVALAQICESRQLFRPPLSELSDNG